MKKYINTKINESQTLVNINSSQIAKYIQIYYKY